MQGLEEKSQEHMQGRKRCVSTSRGEGPQQSPQKGIVLVAGLLTSRFNCSETTLTSFILIPERIVLIYKQLNHEPE